jgi:tetratricopeptide (TPR) repeat protein
MALKGNLRRFGGARQKEELERAQQLIRNKSVPEAQELLHAIIEDDAECAFAYYLLGNTYFKESRNGEALDVYEKALQNNPKLSSAALMIGIIYKQRGDNELARQYLEACIDLDPDSVVAYTQLGRALQEMGKIDEAINCVEHALSLNPQHVTGHLLLADLRATAGETDAAGHILLEVLKDNPKLVAAWRGLGFLKMQSGDLAGAREVFKEAIRINPDSMILHYFLGRIHFHLEEYNSAEAEFRTVVGAVDSFKAAQYGLADALIECENFEEAMEILRKLRKTAPRKNAAHQRFGLIYTRQGRYDAAMQEFKAALKVDPRIAESIPAAAALLGQHGDAESIAKQIADLVVESRNKQQLERAMQAEAGLRQAKKRLGKAGPAARAMP